jgi:hypothetical protein
MGRAFTMLGYEAFIQYLGAEDDRIQKESEAGKGPTAARADYARQIGISADGGRVLLAILLDAYREAKGSAEQYGAPMQACRLDRISHSFGSTQVDNEMACITERHAKLLQTRDTLKSALDTQSFRKVDFYISRRGWIKQPPEPDSNPCPGRSNPRPWETTHLACAGFYEDFVRHIAWTDAENRRVAAGGAGVFDKRGGFYVPIEISDEKLQSVIALSLEADRQIKGADRQYMMALREFNRQNVAKYGVDASGLPPPPEIDAVWKKRGDLLEKYISDLKAELGEDSFMQVDVYFSRQNGSIHTGASAPALANEFGRKQRSELQP